MKSKSLYLDFEFNRTKEKFVELVACCTYDPKTKEQKRFWLYKNKPAKEKLKKYLSGYQIFLTYAAVAECRSFLSLGLDPLSFKWIDFFLEYRMLTNHNDKLQWGKQLVDGKVRNTRKPLPKWERSEEEKKGIGAFKATHSLAEATYKLTGEIRDTKHKDKIRDLILSEPEQFTKEEQELILDYNMEDVIFLERIWVRLQEEFQSMFEGFNSSMKSFYKCDKQNYFREAMARGRYAAHTAIMESRGYPIDYEKTMNFSKQVGNILFDIQREINGYFPEIKPFRWNKKEGKYSWNQKATKDWISRVHSGDDWMKTEGKDLSLSLDAFSKFYNYQHDYPTNVFGAQMLRFLKTKQALYGFSAKEDSSRKNFWDFVGSDKRVRPYMNIYGAQSSRSQPAASGFMFLKPAWMRSLVMPDRGKFIASIDYGSQEFFVSALLSRDENMIKAYLSGDPYFYQAKLSNAVPQNAKKEDYPEIRNLFKATTLGISYLMTKYGLAIKLTADTGKFWDEEKAQEQIDIFYENFFRLHEYQEELKENYSEGDYYIKLPCGWYMFSDNDNIRSVVNVPIQGFGASVMRKAVDLAVERGCEVIFTLHDAIYIEGKVGNEWQIAALRDSMRDAFVYYNSPEVREQAKLIRLDPYAWSPNYEPDSELNIKGWKVPCSNIYIDERAHNDYKKFSAYFDREEFDL